MSRFEMENLMNKENRTPSVSQHLRELLNNDPNINLDISSEDLFKTYKISYSKFYKDVKMKIWDEDADNLYLELLSQNQTLSSMLALTNNKKKRDQEYFFNIMEKAYSKQFDYLQNHLKDYINFISRKYRPAIGMRIVDEYIGSNSIGVTVNGVTSYDIELGLDEFFLTLPYQWEKFQTCYYNILEVGTSDYFISKPNESFKNLFSAFAYEKEYYLNMKENKDDWCFNDETENVYKSLYMLARNRYIKYFCIEELPDAELFSELHNFDFSIQKKSYTLRDLSTIYVYMKNLQNAEENVGRAYNSFKKLFEKKEYTKKFKVQGKNEYSFSGSEIYEGIAAYMFLKKKNVKEEDIEGYEDLIIKRGYAKLLELLATRKLVQYSLITDVLSFFQNEFYDIFKTLNNEYQEFMTTELIGGLERIYASFLRLPTDSIYPHLSRKDEKR